jgi:hypothetical protein
LFERAKFLARPGRAVANVEIEDGNPSGSSSNRQGMKQGEGEKAAIATATSQVVFDFLKVYVQGSTLEHIGFPEEGINF